MQAIMAETPFTPCGAGSGRSRERHTFARRDGRTGKPSPRWYQPEISRALRQTVTGPSVRRRGNLPQILQSLRPTAPGEPPLG